MFIGKKEFDKEVFLLKERIDFLIKEILVYKTEINILKEFIFHKKADDKEESALNEILKRLAKLEGREDMPNG